MKIYQSKSIALAMIACISFFFSGCSKNNITINLGDTPEENSTSPESGSGSSSGTALISFHASIEGRNMTRSLSPMEKGVASLLFAYKSPVDLLESPTEEGLYVTSSVGVLSGVRDYKMYLPDGIYTFFAVSNNTYSTPVQFTDGKSHPLINGVDYLWANNKLQDITSQQVSLPIIYLHMATQVVFEVSSGPGLTLKQLVSATITPTKPGAQMTLVNGDIDSAGTYDSPVSMGINKFLAQYIMLPLQTAVPMKLTLNVLVDDETAPRTYTVDVPVPNGELKAGSSYRFSAVLGDNEVTFSDVSIANWTDVDETGKPLYPKQN